MKIALFFEGNGLQPKIRCNMKTNTAEKIIPKIASPTLLWIFLKNPMGKSIRRPRVCIADFMVKLPDSSFKHYSVGVLR